MPERRKRLLRPPLLVATGILFLVMPVLNLAALAWYRYEANLLLAWQSLRWFEMVLLAGSIPAGLGLLAVTRWGWYYFMFYAFALLSYNITVFVINNEIYNLSAAVQSFLGAVAIVYFTSRDTYAPYLQPGKRGWRRQLRRPLRLRVKVNDVQKETKEISRSGMYLKWLNCSLQAGDEVTLSFTLLGEKFEITGGVVRVDPKGVGIAFRYLNKKELRKIKNKIAELEIEKNRDE